MAAVAIGSEEETRCSKDPRESERKRHQQQHEVLTQHLQRGSQARPCQRWLSRMLLLISCTEGGWEGHGTPLCHEETVCVKGREVALFRPVKGLSDPGLHALSQFVSTLSCLSRSNW